MGRAIEMEGRKFGRLTVKALLGSVNKRRMYACLCDCGTETKVRGTDLRRGGQVSCGCVASANTAARNKANAKHGMTHTGVYRSWFAMRDRCEDPKSPSWRWYGAKGIKVCERWREFLPFFEDMGHRPDGHTLDRIDPSGDYEPSNCRWATPLEQTKNRRMT